MIWAATISKPQFSGGRFWCQVQYTGTDSGKVEVLTETYSNEDPNVLATNWPSSVANARVTQLNALAAVDLSKIPTGAPQPDPVPVVIAVDPAVAAQNAFIALTQQYRQTQAQMKAGIGKVGQSDLDAIVVQIKTNYIDAYAPFLVGLF